MHFFKTSKLTVCYCTYCMYGRGSVKEMHFHILTSIFMHAHLSHLLYLISSPFSNKFNLEVFPMFPHSESVEKEFPWRDVVTYTLFSQATKQTRIWTPIFERCQNVEMSQEFPSTSLISPIPFIGIISVALKEIKCHMILQIFVYSIILYSEQKVPFWCTLSTIQIIWTTYERTAGQHWLYHPSKPPSVPSVCELLFWLRCVA